MFDDLFFYDLLVRPLLMVVGTLVLKLLRVPTSKSTDGELLKTELVGCLTLFLIPLLGFLLYAWFAAVPAEGPSLPR